MLILFEIKLHLIMFYFLSESLIKDLRNYGTTKFVKQDRRKRINAILRKLNATEISLDVQPNTQVVECYL